MISRRRARVRKRVLTSILVFLLIIGGIVLFKTGKYLPALFQLLFRKEIQLKETKENKINILLLGVGGGLHEGPDLTDTMIFTSIDPNTKKVTLISIPRDLWVPELKAKINSAYTFGEAKQEGGGLVLTKAIVQKILNQQIDYAFKIDFNGFVKAVDVIGGLDIAVDRTFDDYQYPITGLGNDLCGLTEEKVASLSAEIATGSASELEAFPCRYEHLHFDKGLQHMDGETALKYVRSRHGTNNEGSDFARSKRQEKVITAFREKVFSLGTLLNPAKAIGLLDTVKDSIETDIKEDEYDDFVKLANKLRGGKIESIAIDAGDQSEERFGLLDSPLPSEEYGMQWVLTPRAGDGSYSEIHEFVDCKLKGIDCQIGEFRILSPTPTPTKAANKN